VWRIYYAHGESYDNSQGQPHEAPPYGVLGVRQDPPGDRQLISRDFYLWREDWGCWIEVDRDGLVDHLLHAARHITACLAGRTVPPAVWKDAMRRMKEA
jgi:hypothetical protein